MLTEAQLDQMSYPQLDAVMGQARGRFAEVVQQCRERKGYVGPKLLRDKVKAAADELAATKSLLHHYGPRRVQADLETARGNVRVLSQPSAELARQRRDAAAQLSGATPQALAEAFLRGNEAQQFAAGHLLTELPPARLHEIAADHVGLVPGLEAQAWRLPGGPSGNAAAWQQRVAELEEVANHGGHPEGAATSDLGVDLEAVQAVGEFAKLPAQ